MTRVGRDALQCAVALPVSVRWLFLLVGSLILLLFLAWLGMRLYASDQAQVTDSIASGSGKCLLKTYRRDYSAFGVAGRMASVFGSRYFYRVYNNAGDPLATSEWNFSEEEVNTLPLSGSARWRCIQPGTAGRVLR